MKTGIISGSFDLLHFGHIEYLNKASKRFDQVVPIINSSGWVNYWKNREYYMAPTHVAEGLRKAYPNFVISPNSIHGKLNRSVNDTLKIVVKELRVQGFTDITFFKMKDRSSLNCPEQRTCFELNIAFEHEQGEIEQHTRYLYENFAERVYEEEYKKWQNYKKENASSL